MDDYESQLLAVERALAACENDSNEYVELNTLRSNLLELLELTKDSTESQTDAVPKQTIEVVDDEMERFKSELNDLEGNANDEDKMHLDETGKLHALRTKYTAMIGNKCSAPHLHSWGAISYHNAIICGIEDDIEIDNDGTLNVRLRVLFTNPTHREMLPCSYFLDGECRFDESKCHFSHGEVVSATQIKEYIAPEFERLARNCCVLAKLQDRLWYRGRVLCVNFMEQQCRVRLDSKEHKERERDFQFEELFPIVNDDISESSSSSDSDNTTEDACSDSDELDDLDAARQAVLIEQSLFNYKPTQPLGEWEKHTRGIASKLMAKMGYVHGTGLGSDGRGIVTPISAQILPQGLSLDACMALREAANGDNDYFSVEKKLKRAQKKQQTINEKAYARDAQRVDVFSFLNGSIFGKTPQQQQPEKPKMKVKEHTTKSLNVESVRIADDIKRKEREIVKMKESIKRNANAADVQKRLQTQLNCMQKELNSLQKEESTLNKEQHARRNKDKMFEF